MKNKKPILGITMGDPSGIGPEIAAKTLAKKKIYDMCRPIIVGDANVMVQAIKITGVDLKVNRVYNVGDALFRYGTMDVYDLKNTDMEQLVYGKVSAMAGKAGFEAVKKVIELALHGEIDATITGPINKEAMNLAGFHYSGHTEIYAHYTKTKNYTMMLACGSLRVVHVSTHVSLREACDLVKKSRVFEVIKLANETCKDLGICSPRIGVAGLNPHAGENGMFGFEEKQEIEPAIEEARKIGINAEGPIPPDTVFSKANGGQYDIVVAMYHDQGHIPMKVVGFNWDEQRKKWTSVSGVNITLGLPIIRVSVDHGTAFGKAGKGTANEESLVNSIEYGVKLANSRKL
ncbi:MULTISPECIES: 4-hydroxythreonine-4-phosphate dehydrogenase PdxA [Clostridium]|uniref:Putative D-threonate 4-phosphate dehydrogenase n=1 Tax=Clostridium lapidicellarium TaxID=3240931 RepID=A0ABV4DT12_9CLOT|nr:4-hydroxythreonine-4-phosphate dehydrogenase PdxA [uncultured Clostridium sp.]